MTRGNTVKPPPRRSGALAWQWVAAAALVTVLGIYGGIEFRRWMVLKKERGALAAKQAAEAVAERRRAYEDTRAEIEARRQADAAAAVKEQEARPAREREAQAEAARRSTEERARHQGDAKRQAEDAAARTREAQVAADKRAAEERARQESEAKRQADAGATRRVREEAPGRAPESAPGDRRSIEEQAPGTAVPGRQAGPAGPTETREPEPRQREAGIPRPGWEPLRVKRFWQSFSNCEPRPLVPVSITRAPRYGTIDIREEAGEASQSYSGGGKCVGTKQNFRSIYYVPTTRAAAEDHFSMAVQFHNGTRVYDCEVSFSDRYVDCAVR